jgi:hypothetical protein
MPVTITTIVETIEEAAILVRHIASLDIYPDFTMSVTSDIPVEILMDGKNIENNDES